MNKKVLLILILAGLVSISLPTVEACRNGIPEDINGDGKVDIQDLYAMIEAYDSHPCDENWNPKADLVKDDNIDLKDIFKVILKMSEQEDNCDRFQQASLGRILRRIIRRIIRWYRHCLRQEHP